jgi:hypothetical protein
MIEEGLLGIGLPSDCAARQDILLSASHRELPWKPRILLCTRGPQSEDLEFVHTSQLQVDEKAKLPM